MKQVAMDGITPFLPQEIITNILEFLPVKSLIRFQSVCKHWENLIKSPSFIAAHLHHSTQHRPCLLFHRYLIRNPLQLYLLDCEMQTVEVQNMPMVDGLVRIAGSSNGLLCLRIHEYCNRKSPPSLLLWNPAFKKVRQVPTTFPNLEELCYVGFGFSPIVNDYKIVKLYVSNYDHQIHVVEVYSLSIGSWKMIEVGNLGGLIMDHECFTVNGTIFWFGFKHNGVQARGYVIVSFDIAMEALAFIPAPAINLRYGVHVTEFENRLAILCSTPVGNADESCLIELWVLEEGIGGSGERWSWTKKYTSSPHQCTLRPITIWRNEIVYMFRLMASDRNTERAERTVLSNFTNTELKVVFNHGYIICNYVESLVPVNNIQVEES